MVLRRIRIGAVTDAAQYDDADFDSAIEVNQPIKAGTPVDPTDVLRLGDIGVLIGDVVGPAGATDNALARFDTATGKKLQNSTVIVDDFGQMKNASQPAFLAQLSADSLNCTGDSTNVHPIIFDTEVFDQNADYNNATGIFTAPVTGKYLFSVCLVFGGLLAAHNDQRISLATSNGLYYFCYDFFAAGANPFTTRVLTNALFVDMDAADVAYIDFRVAGGTKVVDLYGNSGSYRYAAFSGALLC